MRRFDLDHANFRNEKPLAFLAGLQVDGLEIPEAGDQVPTYKVTKNEEHTLMRTHRFGTLWPLPCPKTAGP